MVLENTATNKVKVQFSGLFTNIAGSKEMDMLVSPGTTVGQLVDMLAEKFGKDFSALILKGQGTTRPVAVIYVDRQDIKSLSGMNTILTKDCYVSVVSKMNPWIGG